jgi:tRNA pseudouridine(55) synthase
MDILYKEAGMTMNTFIENYKKEHHLDKVLSTKVCYSGRLDPMARGQVMILTGDECKMMEVYNKKDKTYTFEVIFGLSTDTDDVMGLLNNSISSTIYYNKLVDNIKQYIDIHIGTSFMQDFHDFSSIKYKGKSLWYYALNKINIEKPKHMVTLYNAQYHDIKKYDYNMWRDDICMKINNIDRKNNFRQDDIIKQYNQLNLDMIYSLPITITVSSGFYVRQFVRDIMNYIEYPILTHDINRNNIYLKKS